MTHPTQILDPEESKLLQAMDNDEFISTMKTSESEYWAKIAQKSASMREQKKSIQIRLNPKILNQAKILANHEGIPYQTKIQSLVHQWVNDPKNQSIIESIS